jgi:hypothetical protein
VNRRSAFGSLLQALRLVGMATRTVLAVLASPPTTSGTRTLNMLKQGMLALGASRLLVANLCVRAAADLPALTNATDPSDWAAAQPDLCEGLGKADALLGAWGLFPLSGEARQYRAQQLHWLRLMAEAQGHTRAWALGAEPRHPSRWHQYVSDRHARSSGGPTLTRLAELLVQCPLADLIHSGRTTAGASPASTVCPLCEHTFERPDGQGWSGWDSSRRQSSAAGRLT